jgi:glutamine amidotransferase
MTTRSVGVIDSNICNLTSVLNALRSLDFTAESTDDPDALRHYSHLILPGVGAFAKGMEMLDANGMGEAVIAAALGGKPLLGLCLGMQLLADIGSEFGTTPGLGLIPGTVTVLRPNSPECRVPHIGWNEVTSSRSSPLFRDMPDDPPTFYFVHSYAFDDTQAPTVSAWTDHGGPVVAGVEKGNVFGVQFHPERSQRCGLALLRNFVNGC